MVDAVGSGQGVVTTQLAQTQNTRPANEAPKTVATPDVETAAATPPPPPPQDTGRGSIVDKVA